MQACRFPVLTREEAHRKAKEIMVLTVSLFDYSASILRAMCCRCSRVEDASLLSVRRYGQLCVTYRVDWFR